MTRFVRLVPLCLFALAGCNYGSGNTSAPSDGGAIEAAGSLSLLAASPASKSFGTVAVGASSAPATLSITNSGGTSGLLHAAISGANAGDFAIDSDGCSGTTLAPGASCDVNVHFAPSAAGSDQAALVVTDPLGGQATAALTGDGASSAPPGTLSLTPAVQDFGTVAAGSKGSGVPFVFANKGGSATPPVTVTVTGAEATDFQLTDPCSGKAIAAGASCTVTLVFAPAAIGSKTASLTGTAQGLGAVSASLTGSAAASAAFTLTPATYGFGSILQGTPTAAQTFAVQNTGGVPSGVPAVTVTGANAADFAVSANQCTSALAGGGMCTFAVAFTPSTTGAESATVTVGGTGTTSAMLTGTGLAPAAIALSPMSQAFGSELPGQSSTDTTFTLTNNGGVTTGALAVSLGGTSASQFVIDSDSCTGAMLPATTGTCSIGVHFAPTTGTVGSVQATLDVTGTPGGTTSASLTGIALAPATLTMSPASWPFGTLPWTGVSPSQSFTVTNVGGAASGKLTAALGGPNLNDFATGSDLCTGQTLAPNATCTISAWFAPQGQPLGGLTASLTVGDGTASASGALSATSVQAAALAITPQTGFTGFGPVLLNTPASTTFTVTNGGGFASGVITMSLSGSGEYTLTNDLCSNTTLAPTATCTVGVQFKPTASGPAPVQLNAAATPGGPATYAITGTGASQAALTLAAPSGFTGFGPQQAGTTSAGVIYTMTNTGGFTSGTITDGLASLSPANDYAILSDGCTGKTLASMATCQITVEFTPPAATTGTETASLQASASPGGTPSIGLTGTSYTPAALSMQPPSGFTGFGSVPLGSSSTYVFTLTNSGSQQAGTPTISTNSTFFAVSSLGTCTGPVTTSCTFSVTFTPGTAGPPATDSVTMSATSTPGGTATYGPTTGIGTGAVLTLSPSTWDTTFTACGTQTEDFTITNTGNIPTTSAPSVALSGAQSGAFTVGSYTCLSDLQPNVPCTIPVIFNCPSADPDGYEGMATLAVSAGGATAVASYLDVGAGIAVSPNPATFGGAPIAPGGMYTQTFTVTNFTGAALTHAVTAYAPQGTFAGDYAATDVSCEGKLLAAAGTCQFSVKYTAPAGAAGMQASTLDVNTFSCAGTNCTSFALTTTVLEATEQ